MNAVRSLTLSAVTSNSFNNVGVIASWVSAVSLAVGVNDELFDQKNAGTARCSFGAKAFGIPCR